MTKSDVYYPLLGVMGCRGGFVLVREVLFL